MLSGWLFCQPEWTPQSRGDLSPSELKKFKPKSLVIVPVAITLMMSIYDKVHCARSGRKRLYLHVLRRFIATELRSPSTATRLVMR
jgi:hypothetical protein